MFNVLSLFDGMSCGQIALERAGIKYDHYFASEIDKYAIEITLKNYPDTLQLGDITSLNTDSLPPIGLLMGGSPCQSFSNAGDHSGFKGKSGLFWEFVRVFNEVKPKYFLFENVKMKKEWRDIISRELGVEPILINSALVSAQNRQRYYWTNLTDRQPKDKGIKLADVLEAGVVDRDKSFCLDANYFKGTNLKGYLTKNRRQVVFTERRTSSAKRIRRKFKQAYGVDYSPRRDKELVAREDDKVNCLTTSGLTKEHIVLDKSQCILSTMYKENVKSMLKRNKLGLLVGDEDLDNIHFRKLTPMECERLQTVPDKYTEGVSATQRYRMIGNGWTVDVIAHMLQYIGNKKGAFNEVNLLELF